MAGLSIVNLAMRGLQFFWALLIMALVGNMIATSFAGNPSIVNYDMFVAVFSMLSLFYLIPATVKESFAIHPMIMIALDAINVLLYFCGAVAMAAYLHVHSCGNYVSFRDIWTLLQFLIFYRPTPPPTLSPTVLQTLPSAATRLKPPPRSFGSASLPSLSPLFSLPCRVAAVVSTCAAVWAVSERAAHL